MTDTTPSYGPKIYRAQGGAIMRVKSGGLIDIETGGDIKYNGDSLIDEIAALSGLDSAELTLLNGAGVAGAITASKVVTRDAGSRIPFLTAVVAGAGTVTGDAAVLAAQENLITGANGTVGVRLPVGVAGMVIDIVNTTYTAAAILKVYPDTGGAINGAAADAAALVGPGLRARFTCTAALTWYVEKASAVVNPVGNTVNAGKIAYGIGAVTGTLDVDTGLATVTHAIVSMISDPDGDALMAASYVLGAAGHITIKAWKVTTGGAAGNPTLIAANAAKNIAWVAFGT